jgi:uncharacterized membrane protein (DUF485 family)
MLHEPAAPAGKDYAVAYKTRLGVWMFLVYCVIYVGFVALNLTSPQLMGTVVFAGLNLVTVYGFALIIIALVQAIIYNTLCGTQERIMEAQAASEEEK